MHANSTHTITNHRNGENGFPAGVGCATPKGPLPPKPPPNGPAPPTPPLLPLANGLSNGEDCAAGAEPNGDDLVSDDVDSANGEDEGSAVLNGVEVGNAAQQNNTREKREHSQRKREKGLAYSLRTLARSMALWASSARNMVLKHTQYE